MAFLIRVALIGAMEPINVTDGGSYGDSMRILFLLVVTLLLVAIACGFDGKASGLATQPTAVPTATDPSTPITAAPNVVVLPTLTPNVRGSGSERPEGVAKIAEGGFLEERFVEDAVLQRLGPEPPTLDPHITVSGES